MGWRLLKTHEYPTGRPNSTAVGSSAARKARFANACFTHVAPSRRLGNCSCVALPSAIHGGRLTRGFQEPPPHHPAVPLASNEKRFGAYEALSRMWHCGTEGLALGDRRPKGCGCRAYKD